MDIAGVKSIKNETVKSLRIGLDRSKTNGHDFCELIVNETHKNFTVRLYGNEVYSYGWEAPGEDFIAFLIDTFLNSPHYLYQKIADLSKEDVVDVSATIREMKKHVIIERRNNNISEGDARTSFEELESLSEYEDFNEEQFYTIYYQTLQESQKNNVFSEEPWQLGLIIKKIDEQCWVFCELVAPILGNVLKEVYSK